MSREQAWLLLAGWINARPHGLGNAEMSARLRPQMAAIDATLAAAAAKVFERHLGGYPVDGWVPSRLQRLRRALKRLG